jgi:PAS domain S-box-containing protein
MSLHVEPLSSLPQLRGLLEVTRLVRDERDLGRLVDRIAQTISESLGWSTVAINLYRPAAGDFMVTTVHGNDAARDALLGTTRPADAWTPLLADRFFHRGAYLIPREEGDWDGVPSHVPDLSISSDPDAWHPEDALIVPMRGADGTLLGVVSVDEPESGRLPTDEELDVLVAFAEHVIAAIVGVQVAAEAARDRASLSRLLDISASLVDLDTADSVLETVARGIREALGFDRVVVCLAEDGGFAPTASAGWEPGDAGLDFSISSADLDLLLVPEFEFEGCYLVECEVAERLVGRVSSHRSDRGGAGPRAWSRHWLLVPLVERAGSLRGFIRVDDPSDSLLPSRERLQALRTFANQATMALRAALDFETLSARNRELAALHTTTLGLLERLDLDSVLTRITESACSLVGTPHGYLALLDEEGEELRTAVKLGLLERLGPSVARRGEGIAGRVWESGETIAVDDYSAWDGRASGFDDGSFYGTVCVPLRTAGEVVGVLGLAYRQPGRSFGPTQVALVERFAQLASLALENARLYAALRHSEELHRLILEGTSDLVTLFDLEGKVRYASPSHRDVLGLGAEDIVSRPFQELVHPEDLVTAGEALRAAVDSAGAPYTIRLRHADGHWVMIEGLASGSRNDRGEIEFIVTMSRDVTEQVRLEEQLRQAQKMESVGRLAGGIAHDFNNLLTAIRGYAELMLIDFDTGAGPGRDCAEQIARAADRAASLTGQLLAFSRKQVLRPQLIDLNEIVDGMATMLSRMLGEDVLLSTSLDPQLGPTRADPTQLEQVVLNLAINARDAMPDGGSLLLRTTQLELGEDDELPHPDLAPGSYVTLAVRDTGVGIQPSLAEQVFEPFFTTKDVGEGTGLGLSTVHGIVSQSGGAIWLDSTPGEGSCFTVCLPVAGDEPAEAGL